MPKETTRFVYVAYIRAAPEKVFDAITQPGIAGRYWGHENISDWRPGSKWEHVRNDAGRSVNVAGKVIESTPPRRLVLTWASPADYADPEKHSRVTFEIVPFDGMVRLTVTHEELEAGSNMAVGVSRGWPIVLSSLKSFLETGQSIDVFAKPSDGVDAR